MALRPCVDCGTHVENARRCSQCAPTFQVVREKQRGTTTARGYGSAWSTLSKTVLARDPWCWYCGAPATTVDHVVPKARGGSDDPSNLVPACRGCNSAKGSRHHTV